MLVHMLLLYTVLFFCCVLHAGYPIANYTKTLLTLNQWTVLSFLSDSSGCGLKLRKNY